MIWKVKMETDFFFFNEVKIETVGKYAVTNSKWLD